MSYSYFQPKGTQWSGIVDSMVRFTMDHQLLDAETWKKFTEVFRSNSDDADMGWRCEYWGKMMRGAVLTYQYNGDEELYTVLEQTVRDLMTTPREDGRISTYSDEKQLCGGWDVWGRKYILTGALHFYRICKDEELKKQILDVLCRHADALIAKIGDESEGKTSIFVTSNFWKGVNSCSILEPMVDLYKTTGEKRFLDFASYIIRTGGCEDGSLIELALENKLMPYQYPEVKAYETMSFFEGVLAYGEVTGEEKYVEAALKFIEAVNDTDITVIGCSGCTHELFDNSKEKQIEYSEIIMQETCVTVTWMRILAILYLKTGEKKYMDRLERSMYNAMYGSVNSKLLVQYERHSKRYMPPLPFDSYSPLYNNRRGVGIGGFKEFSFGGYYGCCACIASAGIALSALCAAVRTEDGVAVNVLVPGTMEYQLESGRTIRIESETAMPRKANASWRFSGAEDDSIAFSVREADYLENRVWKLNGAEITPESVNGYAVINRKWNDGDVLELGADLSILEEKIGTRTALTYGPIVLCRDSAKESGEVDLTETISLVKPYTFELERENPGELLRMVLVRADGKEDLLMTDYQSCGKGWLSNPKDITVWQNLA